MTRSILILLPLSLLSCADQFSAKEAAPAPPEMNREQAQSEPPGDAWGGVGGRGAPAAPVAVGAARDEDGVVEEKSKGEGGAWDRGGGVARAWFPESFLWMPLVETSAAGTTRVPVTVPDTLTTWRVLAVAQSAEGAQGGTVASFLSTLPAYVDVVAPSFVYAGDRLGLPVQVVNQGEGALSSALTVSAGDGGFAGAVTVPVGGSAVRVVPLGATTPGALTVRAALGDIDTVEKQVVVRPSGRPVEQIRGGTLGGPRTVSLDGVPGGRYGGLRVVVFPGARSVIAAEAGVAGERGNDVTSAAYAYALAGMAQPLAGSGEVTEDGLRTLSIRALQRLTYTCRVPDANRAAAAYAGLRGSAPDTLAGRLAERLADTVRSGQQPDGLYGLEDGAALDAVLIQTARAVWALGPDAGPTRLRAQGGFERYRDRLDTPSVAAWALAAGLVEGERATELRAGLTEALLTAPDGTRHLPGTGSVSDAEVTALGALVLEDPAVRADLAAHLLTRHTGWQGFGPGWANLVSIEAIRAVMGGEVPSSVRIRLTVDGVAAGEASLDPAAPYVPVTLTGPAVEAPGPHTVQIAAEPAVPGLAFTLAATTYLPWVQQASAGLDVRVTPGPLRAGEGTTLDVVVAGPGDAVVDVDVGLPAGFTVDKSSLPSDGSWLVEDGALHGTGLRLVDGRWSATVRGTPELAGALQTGPTAVAAWGERFVRVPETWTVR